MGAEERVTGMIVIIAALIVAFALNYGSAQTLNGCYLNTAAAPFFGTVNYIDNTSLSVAGCCASCTEIGLSICGMSSGTLCICSKTAPSIGAGAPCNKYCPASSLFCGSSTDNRYVSVYDSSGGGGGGGGASANFSLSASVSVLNMIEAMVIYESSSEVFYINFGDGSPIVKLSNINNTLRSFNGYLLPELYDLTVTGMIPNTSLSSMQIYSTWYNATPAVRYVECPKIAIPNEMYICNVSISYMNRYDYFTMQFNDSSPSETLSSVGNIYTTIGTKTPKGPSDEADTSGPLSNDTILLIGHPVPVRSLLTGIEFNFIENGTFSYSFVAPTCAAGLQYCMYQQTCKATCPDNPATFSFSCPGDAFCYVDDACCTFTVSTTPPNWTTVIGPVSVPVTDSTKSILGTGAGITLEPSWVLQVDGPLRRRSTPGPNGDWVSGQATNFSHYAMMTIEEFFNVTAEHSCTTVLQNVMLSVSHVSPAITLSSTPSTMCERNITSFTVGVNQSQYSASLNIQQPFYVWCGSLFPFQILLKFPEAGPIIFSLLFTPFDTMEGNALPEMFWKDYPFENGPYVEPIIRTLLYPDVYTLEIEAYNDHNLTPDPITGIIPNGIIQSVVIIAQNPISPLWAVFPNSTTANIFFTSNGNPSIKFVDSNAWPFPTNTTVTINWGDLSIPESTDFVDPGTSIPIFTHNYMNGGTYVIVCNITNIVSGVFDLNTTIIVYEAIEAYNVTVGYYLTPTAALPKQGFGMTHNMYPLNKNVSFFPVMTRGTVDQFKLTFTNNGSLVSTYNVTDIFHPMTEIIQYKFNVEAFVNLTLTAVNMFQAVPINLYIQIVNKVLGLQIDDFSIVSKPKERKTINIKFVSVGGGTCLAVDYGDLTTYESFGDASMCALKFSYAVYNPTVVLDLSFNITHVYSAIGIYNLTAIAISEANNETAMLMFIVSTMYCSPPVVSIVAQAADYLSAPSLFKGKQYNVEASATVNCSITKSTKKRWQILTVDYMTGIEGSAIEVMNILPSWESPVFVIPPGFLNYGLYLCLYTITMWDPKALPVQWPLQKQIKHYINIVPTPLIPKMVKSSVWKTTIGLDQYVDLEPAVYSVDPDFPTTMNFSIAWKCRNVAETWPASTASLSMTIGSLGTGCFGNGPGFVSNPSPSWSIFGNEFLAIGSYEVVALVTKDVRTYPVTIQINVVTVPVPILDSSCSSEILCAPNQDGNGVRVNANVRLGLVAPCVENCDGPMIYTWTVTDAYGTAVSLGPDDVPMGTSGAELSLATNFFTNHPNLNSFMLTVSSQNAKGQTGSQSYFMKRNMPPVNGICSLDSYTVKALVDISTLICLGWTDPEGIGINTYTVRLLSANTTSTLLEQQHSALPKQVMPLVLPVGVYTLTVTVLDMWGATTVFTLPQVVNALPISYEEFMNSNSSEKIQSLLGGGNTDMLNMAINARNSIISTAPYLNINDPSLNATEKEALLLLINSMNSESVNSLMADINYPTKGSAEVAAGILASIMAQASASPDGSLTIDFFTRGDIYSILNKLVDQIGNLPIGSPEELRNLMESVTVIAAGLVTGSGEVSTGGCTNIPPKDVSYTANMVDYDTEIKSIDMTIPADLTQAKKCNIMDLTKEATNLQMPRLMSLMNKMSSYVLQKQIAGESMEVPTANNMTVVCKIMNPPGLAGRHYCGKSWVEFPDGTCPQGSCDSPVALALKEWPTLIYIASKHADLLTGGSRVLDVDISDRGGKMLTIENSPLPISLSLYRTLYKRGNSTPPSLEIVDAPFETQYQSIPIMYTTFNNTKNGTGFTIEIAANVTENLFIIVKKSKLPTLKSYDTMTLVKDIAYQIDETYSWMVLVDPVNGYGQYYIGVAEFNDNVTAAQRLNPMNYSSDLSWLRKPMTINYSISIFTSGCYYFDNDTQSWKNDGMMTKDSTFTSVGCQTNHLTSFGGSLFAMPNTIDFSYVFAHMGFNDNLTIYVTLIICLTAFILLMIWARHQDRKDIKKLGAAPMPDNLADDKYLYEILVFTGDKKEAQTDSTVQFILTGDFGDTEVRTFGDDERKIFRKGDVNVFVMAVPKPLGPLSYLHIWHDNSGKGPNASWHLSYIVVRDVQTGRKYEFVCNDWLALEKSDGQIERIIGVAGREQKSEFGFLLSNNSSRKISDSHLWFSIFMRPPRSRFTRCQRVGTCFALLFLSMLTNAMWYQTAANQPATGAGLSVGPFSLTPAQIGIGVMSALISFPPTFLIAFVFRKSRPDKLRKSRIQEALEKASKQSRKNRRGNTQQDGEDSDEEEGKNIETAKTNSKNSDKKKKKKKKKFVLPAWCKYLGWALVFACIIVSVFFLLSYGVMFGNDRATKWVTALVISFFSSILFIQPVQVILMAMLVSAMFKNTDLDDDDADEDEESPDLDKDQLWLYEGERSKRLGYSKLQQELLDELRRRRKSQLEMNDILKELFGYSIFIGILLLISYGQRDPNGYYLKNSLMQSFINLGLIDGSDFSQIQTTDDFWNYLPQGFMRPLRADTLYNGKPPYQLRGFLNDYANRIMGYATIRQIRAKKNTCSVSSLMKGVSKQCSGFTNLEDEESRSFCVGWNVPNTLTKNTSDCQAPEFRYETANQLQSLPIWARQGWYGGGGYVIHLSGKTNDILKKYTYLQKNFWIDKLTRAVIIEFSTYNSQVNLFGICTLVIEYLPGSVPRPSYRFDAVSLFPTVNKFGSFVIACEIIFCIFIVYFSVRESFLIYKQRASYFDSYWSYAELAMIFVAYIAIILYFVRDIETNKAVSVFANTFGNGYVRMTYAVTINEYYGYAISFLVFVGTIKFIKILRFNKRMGFLSATLKHCWDDLIGFMMAFLICFCSFVALFFFLIGTAVVDFATFTAALATCFNMMMGKFQFNQMVHANPFAPIMFFVFVVCTSFVLMNLLITLIIKSFEEVKKEIDQQENEYEIVDYVWSQFKTVIGQQRRTNESLIQPPIMQEHKADDVNNDVSELPSKVDKFLDYVNKTYFDGTMDWRNKDAITGSFNQGRQILCGDEGVGVDRIGFGRNKEPTIAPRNMFNAEE